MQEREEQRGAPLTADPIRFLALAFATADLLFEADATGAITFVAGAAQRMSGRREAQLMGAPFVSLFDDADKALAEALLLSATDGVRRGPAVVRLCDQAGPRYASFSAFRMPGADGRVSCALSLCDPPQGATIEGAPSDGRLMNGARFQAAAHEIIGGAHARGVEVELGLIELAGLKAQSATLPQAERAALERKVAGALRAESIGEAAAELGEDRFAILRKPGDAPEALAMRLSRVLGASLTPKVNTFAVDGQANPARMMRALRFAIDTFIATGGPGEQAASLSEVLDQSLQETAARVDSFEAMVRDRRFQLMFQPVVALSDGSVRHHEVLVRFDGEESPFAVIRMAEELDIIESLDRAVADEAIKRLRADKTKRLHLAVNVSGRTIVSPGFLKTVQRLTDGADLAGRLIFEVTESAVIEDLALAQKHVKALQAMGFKVCIDDFGAGAASLGYLKELSVDVVKIDGAYVRGLADSGRDDAMIRHLVGLCHELNILIVAEMVETEAVADILRRAGVDYAQGWLYGAANREPQGLEAPAPPRAAKRRGVVEGWG
jgi:EAL domain-containing protein (putative c-di-GMP-specific phosphodiesterase class I)